MVEKHNGNAAPRGCYAKERSGTTVELFSQILQLGMPTNIDTTVSGDVALDKLEKYIGRVGTIPYAV